MKYKAAALLFLSFSAQAASLQAPTDPIHPGSKNYSYTFTEKSFSCGGRAVQVLIPNAPKVSVISYGHGQALEMKHYRKTFEHLAKKGVGVIFPAYDTGFFDQDWQRMGRDFVNLTNCAVSQVPGFDSTRIIYSGHSKGAYVASIAAGLVGEMKGLSPKAAVLFAPAGTDAVSLGKISPEMVMTVIFSDGDTVVSRAFSDDIYRKAGSTFRQFILVKSYPDAKADHMWPLTSSTLFGGGDEGPLHYYGSWKWLTAAAQDLADGAKRENPYVYGPLTADKGNGTLDEVQRNW